MSSPWIISSWDWKTQYHSNTKRLVLSFHCIDLCWSKDSCLKSNSNWDDGLSSHVFRTLASDDVSSVSHFRFFTIFTPFFCSIFTMCSKTLDLCMIYDICELVHCKNVWPFVVVSIAISIFFATETNGRVKTFLQCTKKQQKINSSSNNNYYVILMLFWGHFGKEYKFVLPLIIKCIIFVHFHLGIQICHPDHHVFVGPSHWYYHFVVWDSDNLLI